MSRGGEARTRWEPWKTSTPFQLTSYRQTGDLDTQPYSVHNTFVLTMDRLINWLAVVLSPLRERIAEHAASRPGPAAETFADDARRYLQRAWDALERHLDRLAAGLVVPRAPAEARAPVTPSRPPRQRRQHGWLIHEIPLAERVRFHMQWFLAAPETQALCGTSPRADRLLGQFRYALAIPTGDPWRGPTLAARLRRARDQRAGQPAPAAGHPGMTDEELAELGIVRTGRTMRMGSFTLRVPDCLPPWPPPTPKPA